MGKSKKILFIVTSVDTIPRDKKPTGYFLPEFAHPYKILVDNGYTDVTVVSPKGGVTPCDPSSCQDPDAASQWFLNDATAKALVANTKTPEGISGRDYAAVIYPGGHGPMFDLATDTRTAKITMDCYNNGGIVATVCHGAAGIVPCYLPSGEPLIKGKNVTGFTNKEEEAVQLVDHMPFLVEDKYKELGAIWHGKPDWEAHVQVDGRLITGQNPNSSQGMGEAVLAQLEA